jgi:cytoskeletal protein CcmA (bactofilin family)
MSQCHARDAFLRHGRVLIALYMGLSLATGSASAQTAGASSAPALPSTETGNRYLAGPTVRISAPIDGDLLATAGRVLVQQAVSRDAAIAGGDVTIQADIGEDLRAVGGAVTLDSRIGGDVHVVAGRLSIGPEARMAGRAWLAGGDVEVRGRLPGESKIYAGHLLLDNVVDGNLTVHAERLELRPGTRISGVLRYSGPNRPVWSGGAQVQGGVFHQPMSMERHSSRGLPGYGYIGGLLTVLGMIAAGIVWTLFFPVLARSAQDRLAQAPGTSLAVGALVFLAAPLAVGLLLITIVGAPLALALFAAYWLVLMIGYLVVAGFLGERMLQAAAKDKVATPGWRILALTAALLVLGLLAMLPLLGWLLTVVALMAGSGALLQRLHSRWRHKPT